MNNSQPGSVGDSYSNQSASSSQEGKLFTAGSVALATFLGAPLAGSILMAINYRRMGKGGNAAGIVALGVGLTAAGLAVGYFIPSSMIGTAGILVAIMWGLADKFQGLAIEQHVRQGGMTQSAWAAAGVGVVFSVVLLGGLFAFELQNLRAEKVVVGKSDEVFYLKSATKEEAQSLGEALKEIGYFMDRGATVFLEKSKEGTVVSFTVQDGVWDEPEMIRNFYELSRAIAPSAGGFPLRVRLVNTARETKKQFTVGRVAVGTEDEIYYYGSAEEAEAQALAKALTSNGFFQNRGVSVFLAKEDGGTSLSFIVGEGAWDDPDIVTDFQDVVRDVAPSVGGLPIKLRLLDDDLQARKEVKVA